MDEARSLLQPFRLGSLTLVNRVVMAPMTRSRAADGGVPTEMMATYYRQRASAGLIVTEGIEVSPQAKGFPGTPGIHTAEQRDGWRGVVEAVHAEGAPIFAQLWHVGRVSHSSLQPDGRLPVAPSPIPAGGKLYTAAGMVDYETPQALSAEGIADVVGQFAEAARLAREAGFDGVELQASNGYLLDQFLRDGSNQRADDYGGAPSGRVRLLLEVLAAVKAHVAADRIGVRVSPLYPLNGMVDSDPEGLFLHLAERLAEAGCGYIHGVRTGGDFPWARLRAAFGGPVILAGGFDGETAQAAIDAGQADLIAFANAYIANPDLVRRIALGLPFAAAERKYFYSGGSQGYIDYEPHPTRP